VNHEFSPSALKDGLHEVDSEAAQSVSVHDHNILDQLAECGVQNGNRALPLEVDTAANVGDELVVWERLLQVFLLTREVRSLVTR